MLSSSQLFVSSITSARANNGVCSPTPPIGGGVQIPNIGFILVEDNDGFGCMVL